MHPGVGHGRGYCAMHDIDTTRYLDQLYPYAMVLARNPGEAEDLVQETYVRALKSMGGLREDSKVKSWLFTNLAKHLAQPAAATPYRP
jgi:DNA-directed RNA polymerase specialized sigma24 family protein